VYTSDNKEETMEINNDFSDEVTFTKDEYLFIRKNNSLSNDNIKHLVWTNPNKLLYYEFVLKLPFYFPNLKSFTFTDAHNSNLWIYDSYFGFIWDWSETNKRFQLRTSTDDKDTEIVPVHSYVEDCVQNSVIPENIWGDIEEDEEDEEEEDEEEDEEDEEDEEEEEEDEKEVLKNKAYNTYKDRSDYFKNQLFYQYMTMLDGIVEKKQRSLLKKIIQEPYSVKGKPFLIDDENNHQNSLVKEEYYVHDGILPVLVTSSRK